MLRDVLNTVVSTAKSNKISKPYLVGGFPRDVYMKRINKISDVDITTGDDSVVELAELLLKTLKGSSLMKYSDGHAKLRYEKISIDFSSNFKIPGISEILKGAGIIDPKSMQEELYSRDFTVNTLLMPLDLSSIMDSTGLAFKDIENKILDTCLPPETTFSNDPRRIIRVVYLCAKLGFKPSQRVVEWVSENNTIMNDVPEGYIKEKTNKAFKADAGYAKKLIEILKLETVVPGTSLSRSIDE